MTRFDVTTLGEGGLRLSVPSGVRLVAADRFDVEVIGAEANVVSSLSNLGWRTAWASAVHRSPVGERVLRGIKTHGVDTSLVTRCDEGRTGTYYVEYAASPRPTSVFYDRAGTAFANLDPDTIDWSNFADARIVHLTGLTAALGPGPRAGVNRAVAAAREAAVPVSFDVNYRSHLWAPNDAAQVLQPLIEGVELLSCSNRDAETVFGLGSDRQQCLEGLAKMSGARYVFMSVGADGLMALIDGEVVETSSRASTVIDRLGAGDGMAAGIVHAWLSDEMANAVNYGAVMAGLALTQHGEPIITSVDEVRHLVQTRNDDLLR